MDTDTSESLIKPIDILVTPDCTPDLFVSIDPSQVPQHPITERLNEINRAIQALQPAPAKAEPAKSEHTIEDALDLWTKGRAVSESTRAKDRSLTAMLAYIMPLSTLVADIDEQAVRVCA